MKLQSVVKFVIGGIFIVTGVVWTIAFPKTKDIFRPDFVASVAIGIGLIVPGIVILFFRKSRALKIILSIVLLWSLLLNLFLFSYVSKAAKAIQDTTQRNSSTKTK